MDGSVGLGLAGRRAALPHLQLPVATPAALMQKVIPKEALKQSYLYLVAGQELAREALLEHLVQWGYQNVPLVEERGDFSVRGGIVDLFSPGYARPLRLEFNGDVLESIRQFSPSSQRSEQPLEDALLLPVKEFSLKRASLDGVIRALDQRANELDIDRKEKNAMLDALRGLDWAPRSVRKLRRDVDDAEADAFVRALAEARSGGDSCGTYDRASRQL
jgi:transcription-repair coupling factor (superfamily II helicase)